MRIRRTRQLYGLAGAYISFAAMAIGFVSIIGQMYPFSKDAKGEMKRLLTSQAA